MEEKGEIERREENEQGCDSEEALGGEKKEEGGQETDQHRNETHFKLLRESY